MDFRKKYEVVVAGGGIAGVAAALAAARNGKKTVLIEKTVLPGGLATSGIVNVYLPLCDGNGTQVSFGLVEELIKASMIYGPGEIPADWDKGKNLKIRERFQCFFSPASFVIAMDKLLEEAGVDVWYDTVVIDVRTTGRRIKKVVVANKSGTGTISGKCFVDATGDSDLAFMAGDKCPEDSNFMTIWTVERRNSEGATRNMTDDIGIKVLTARKPGDGNDIPAGINGKIVTDTILRGRRVYRQMLEAEYADGTSDRNTHYPLKFPVMAPLRRTRCIDGRFTLKEGMEWQRFDDSVGVAADWRKAGYVWEIPYRTLLPRRVKGLLAAGRCTAAHGDAWEVTRVIPIAAMTGEVAGVAASMAVDMNVSPEEVPYGLLAGRLRDRGFVLHFDELGLTREAAEAARSVDESNAENA